MNFKLQPPARPCRRKPAPCSATWTGWRTGLADRLIANLDEVTRRRQEAAEGGAETGRLSRQIANRIAIAVSALQLGDMTRQRVEHVEAALQTRARTR
jgi:hypothetical protein